ncbi:hypothetical protein [Streptomyces sp. NPDC060010]|uniref:hypothetical protein n=1 Tax=Streptomyces sp. NPDC060010 TaxID=3347036 RepID=UPI0036AD09ED
MTYVEYLLSMDLRSRAEILQRPSAHQRITTVHEWVAVLGKTADALIEQASGTAPSEWSFYSQSMETAFGAAVESGLLSEREALMRRLNLSLALMVDGASIIGGDYLRDPRTGIAAAIFYIDYSPEELAEKCQGWEQRCDLEEMKKFHGLKVALKPMIALLKMAQAQGIDVGDSLRRWSHVYPRLP